MVHLPIKINLTTQIHSIVQQVAFWIQYCQTPKPAQVSLVATIWFRPRPSCIPTVIMVKLYISNLLENRNMPTLRTNEYGS
jgi:hypothetical protein